MEARAYVTGNLMRSDLARYDIRSWTADSSSLWMRVTAL